jgi:hypothetical protein
MRRRQPSTRASAHTCAPCELTPSLGPRPRNYRCDELHDCNQDCAITCIGVACSDAAALAGDTAEGAKPIRELCHLTRGPVIFSLYARTHPGPEPYSDYRTDTPRTERALAGLYMLRKNSGPGRKDVPQGTSGAKSPKYSQSFTARLKSCPDTKQSFCAACLAASREKSDLAPRTDWAKSRA